MPKKESKLYIDDILESIRKIEGYVKGLSNDQFLEDERTIDAVVRNLSIIGEAVKNLPDEIKTKHIEIPWNEIIGMRNKVIHEYSGVDTDILWETAKKDLPIFKNQIIELSREI